MAKVRRVSPSGEEGQSDAFSLDILRNSHNLAEEMGNSVTIVRKYYDAVVSPSVAKLWWKIRPEEPENVVPMKAAT
jgi:hypothetical protein